jgi:hypothetical protein
MHSYDRSGIACRPVGKHATNSDRSKRSHRVHAMKSTIRSGIAALSSDSVRLEFRPSRLRTW